jgi:hypothetical protein
MSDRALVLRCYIEGAGRSWQGICVDLDIAAEGESLEEVRTVLDDMISTYLDSAMTYPTEERQRLLNRKSPLLLRIKFATAFFVASMFAIRRGNDRVGFISHRICPA